ncbi:MAG TPA: hypothetical protein VFY90_06555 [Tepidiformaceae bacterium]|nr:hypothetical protein [Tepidiformaceae bacterium]
MRGQAGSIPRRTRLLCALAGLALAMIAAFARMPAGAFADEPQVASSGASNACLRADANCAVASGVDHAPAVGGPHLIPSRPSELARGHEDQSGTVLALLGLVGFAGLVVSVLHRLSLED